MQKSVIVTCTTKNKFDFLVDFLISIRTLGNYDGEIIVMTYDSCSYTREFASFFNTRILEFELDHGHVANRRFVDIIPFLEYEYADYVIAHFDIDIWFRNTITPLFDEVLPLQGCLYAVEFLDTKNIPPSKFNMGAPVKSNPILPYHEQMKNAIFNFGGQINIGFMAGHARNYIEKLKKMKGLFYSDFSIEDFCADQYITNVIFDTGRDSINGQKWNCVTNDLDIVNGNYIHKFNPAVEPCGIHFYNATDKQRQEQFRFSYFNSKLENEILFQIVKDKYKRLTEVKSFTNA